MKRKETQNQSQSHCHNWTESQSFITLPLNVRLIFSIFLRQLYDQFKNIFRSRLWSFFSDCFVAVVVVSTDFGFSFHIFFLFVFEFFAHLCWLLCFMHFELFLTCGCQLMLYAFILVAFKRESKTLAGTLQQTFSR